MHYVVNSSACAVIYTLPSGHSTICILTRFGNLEMFLWFYSVSLLGHVAVLGLHLPRTLDKIKDNFKTEFIKGGKNAVKKFVPGLIAPFFVCWHNTKPWSFGECKTVMQTRDAVWSLYYFREFSQTPKYLDEATLHGTSTPFLLKMFLENTRESKRSQPYLLSSKHAYRPMRLRRIVSQSFRKCLFLHFFSLQKRHNLNPQTSGFQVRHSATLPPLVYSYTVTQLWYHWT